MARKLLKHLKLMPLKQLLLLSKLHQPLNKLLLPHQLNKLLLLLNKLHQSDH